MLGGELVGVVVRLARVLPVAVYIVRHLRVRGRVVAFERVLGVRLEEGPTSVEVDVNVVLAAAFVVLHVGAVNADDVADLTHNWTLFEPVRVDNHHGEVEILIPGIAFGVEGAIDDFEGTDPLALAGLDGVGRVDDHSVDVYLVRLL